MTDRADPCAPIATKRTGWSRVISPLRHALLSYLVLLPMGFAEPDRSPGLLVSSYLAVSPLPSPGCQAPRPRRFVFCGTVPIRAEARTVGVTHHRALWSPDFPPRHIPELEPLGRYPDRAARTQAPRRSSRPPRTSLSIIRSKPERDHAPGQRHTSASLSTDQIHQPGFSPAKQNCTPLRPHRSSRFPVHSCPPRGLRGSPHVARHAADLPPAADGGLDGRMPRCESNGRTGTPSWSLNPRSNKAQAINLRRFVSTTADGAPTAKDTHCACCQIAKDTNCAGRTNTDLPPSRKSIERRPVTSKDMHCIGRGLSPGTCAARGEGTPTSRRRESPSSGDWLGSGPVSIRLVGRLAGIHRDTEVCKHA